MTVSPRSKPWLILLACLPLAGLSASRAQVFHSELALWADAVSHTPTTRAAVNYRSALFTVGRFEEAIQQCGPIQRWSRTARDRSIADRLCLPLSR